MGLLPRDSEEAGAERVRPALIESNLSATLFALDALKAAGETDAEVYKAAAIFVRPVQNERRRVPLHLRRPGSQQGRVSRIADPLVFHSYGSTTADGLRALALCDDPADAERRESARKWL